MKVDRFLRAVLVGLAITAVAAPLAVAQSLQIQNGATTDSITVSTSRAIVVEADQPFAEVSIANPAVADISTLSDRSIYILGKAPGRTTLTLLGPDGRLITNVEVQVAPDIGEFKERLRQILPNEQIEVRTAADGIVLSGTVSSITSLDRALDLAGRYAPGRVSNLMMVGGTQQVMLKVRFAEMSREVSKGLSSSFAFASDAGDVTVLGGTGGGNIAPTGSATATEIDTGGADFGELGLSFNIGSLGVAALIEALESKSLVRTLAEPNLIALSGQEARFLAGGEYPIPIADNDGSVTVQYKPFGVELRFTPRVVMQDQINLELNAAVSSVDGTITVGSGAFAVNAFRRREANTTVELRDGQSFAIAGLIEDDFSDAVDQLPWVGDVPILGALFRSASYQRRQSELVVIVTAHLVSPVNGEALAVPTSRVRPPSEAGLFLNGSTANVVAGNDAAAEVAKQDFSGSYGYVME